MSKDISEHLVDDKDNKFHGTSVAQRIREFPGMTLDLYLEVQKIWEDLQRERVSHKVTKARYSDLCGELTVLVGEHN